jgi:hypothetical protein
MKTTSPFLMAILLVLLAGNLNAAPPTKTSPCDFKSTMCGLWEDHIVWTRNVILNFLDTLPGTNEAVGRLLQNQVDIGDAIKPYYGEAAGTTLTNYLRNHILIAADILVALREDNTANFNTAAGHWYANADSIAFFLSGANPNWLYADIHHMMVMHLDLTAAEALARKNKDYAADITAYDAVHDEILEMCDMLANGIIAQFPNQFSGPKSAKKEPQEVILANMDILLDQNVPNPFTEKTTIAYTLPETVNEAQIIFSDVRGRVIKTVALQQKGEAELTAFTATLSKGFYTYSIVADGMVIDTKRMVKQ